MYVNVYNVSSHEFAKLKWIYESVIPAADILFFLAESL